MRIQNIIIGVVLSAFFVSTLYLVVGLPVIFNSPDESANFTFSSAMAENQQLYLVEEDNVALHGILHPRSIVAIGDRMVPRSFLGLSFVYGSLGVIFGKNLMLFVTPVLAVLAILAWRGVIKYVFSSEPLANLSALLFMIHPAFWYYSGRTMMHNVGFISFLIFSLWFFAQSMSSKKSHWRFGSVFFSGATLGLALAFRTSEIIWIAPMTLTLLWWVRQKISWQQIIFFGAGLLVALTPFGFFNQSLYGSLTTTGYHVVGDANPSSFVDIATENPDVVEPVSPTFIDRTMNVLFPFGIAEKATVRHVWQYGVALYPWMTASLLIGFVMVLSKHKKLEHSDSWFGLSVLLVALSMWLGIVYGSWTFHDNPDTRIFSLGNSYVRYWLPLFLMASPFGAFALLKSTLVFKSSKVRGGVIGFLVVVLALLSFNLVYFGDDGFAPTRRALISFDQKRSDVLDVTEDDAIVIVDRADKFIFPSRRVVTPLRSETTYAALPALLETAPLYYFGITFPQSDLDYLNDVKLAETELKIEFIQTSGDESLYKISQND